MAADATVISLSSTTPALAKAVKALAIDRGANSCSMVCRRFSSVACVSGSGSILLGKYADAAAKKRLSDGEGPQYARNPVRTKLAQQILLLNGSGRCGKEFLVDNASLSKCTQKDLEIERRKLPHQLPLLDCSGGSGKEVPSTLALFTLGAL